MDLENIVVDITQRNYNTLQTIQYDVDSRYVNVKIVNNGKNVDLTNYMVSIACKKPDGKIVFNETEMIEPKQGLIKFLISEQISVALGEVVCELKIYGKNSSVLTTQYFTINVTKPIADKSIQSTNEFRQLTIAMNEYNAWIDKVEEKYNGLEKEYAEELTEIKKVQQSVFVTLENVEGIDEKTKFVNAVKKAKMLNATFQLTKDITISLDEDLDLSNFDGRNHIINLQSQYGFLLSSNTTVKNCTIKFNNAECLPIKSNESVSHTYIKNINCEYIGSGLAWKGIQIAQDTNNRMKNLTFKNIVYCCTIKGINKSGIYIDNLTGYNTGQTVYISGRSADNLTWLYDVELRNIKLINTKEEKTYIESNFQQNGQGVAGFDVVLAENVYGMTIKNLYGENVCERMLYCSNAMNVDVDNVVSYSSNGVKFCGYNYIDKRTNQPTTTSVISKNFNASNIKLYGENEDALLQIYDCENVVLSDVMSSTNEGEGYIGFLVRGGRKLENIIIRNADVNKLKRCVFEYSKNFPYAEDSLYRYNESINGLKFNNVNCRGIGLIKYSPRNCIDILSDTVTSERIYRNIEMLNCSFMGYTYAFHTDRGGTGYGMKMLIDINNIEGLVIKNVRSRGHFLSYGDNTFNYPPLFPIRVGSNSRDIHINYETMTNNNIDWNNVFDECYVSDESKFTVTIGSAGKNAHIEFIPNSSTNAEYTTNIKNSYAYKGWLKSDKRATFFFPVAKATVGTFGSVRATTPDGTGYFNFNNETVKLESQSTEGKFYANSWSSDGTTRIYCDTSNTKDINIRCSQSKIHLIEFFVNVEI